jgi:hypothetical protein
MAERIRDFGTPLIVHSTPLWLLAEFGLLGFAIFAVPALRILFYETRRFRTGDSASETLILILVALGLVSIFHELLYQRGFWLLFGAAMAYTPSLARQEFADVTPGYALKTNEESPSRRKAIGTMPARTE